MFFKVTARDARGMRQVFSREAESRADLMIALRVEKLLVLSVEEEKSTDALPPVWNPAWLKPMTSFDVEMGLRQIASMLRSGIPLLKALQTTADQAVSPRAKRTWLHVTERVFGGRPFAAALAGEGKRFDEIVVRLAEVGERAGELERTIARAADQLEARRNLSAQVLNALVYPFVAVLMAVGVSAFLVAVVIPKIAEFLRSGGAELPMMTQMLMDISDWLVQNGLGLLLALVGAVVAWVLVRLTAVGREYEDVFLLKIPITGRILRLSCTALFARSMEIMTDSGVTLLDSLQTGAALLANRRFRRRVTAARLAVVRGASLSEALSPAVEFLPMLRRMAAVGEVAGSLPESFGEAAHFHEIMLAAAVRRFGMLIEPVMIVVTGGIVGFVYIAFFLAIFAIAGTN